MVSAASSGAILTPLMLGAIVGSLLSGTVVSRLGRYRPVALAGQALSVVGIGLLVRLSVGSGTMVVALAMIVLGLGLFSHEAVREWEVHFAPLLAGRLRAKRRGQGGP